MLPECSNRLWTPVFHLGAGHSRKWIKWHPLHNTIGCNQSLYKVAGLRNIVLDFVHDGFYGDWRYWQKVCMSFSLYEWIDIAINMLQNKRTVCMSYAVYKVAGLRCIVLDFVHDGFYGDGRYWHKVCMSLSLYEWIDIAINMLQNKRTVCMSLGDRNYYALEWEITVLQNWNGHFLKK